MKHLFLALSLSALSLSPAMATPQADQAWGTITALDAGPGKLPTTREEAQTIAVQFLQAKEQALRSFLAAHPSDPRATEALIRLAHVMTTQSDFKGQPAIYQNAVAMLEQALALATKAQRQEEMAQLTFAKISLTMRRAAAGTPQDRDRLLAQIRSFERQFPSDKRLGALYAEVATLYDQQPKQKQKLLEEALKHARSEEVKGRVLDDLKRLSYLGQPVTVKGKSVEGEVIDSASHRGKIVLIYFFAGFAPSSLDGLAEINALRSAIPASQLEIMGVCLDPTAEAVQAIAQAKGVAWPLIWEKAGWQSPLLRGFAINALPTTWVLDKSGTLRTLNAKDEVEGLVRSLLKQN